MPDQLTGASLEEALRSGDFERAPVELVGMVKPSDEDGTISFAPTDCESWVDVPTDLIENAEHVGHRPCRDHSHPVFRLTLKQSEDPAARILTTLLGPSMRSGAPGFSRLAQQAPTAAPSFQSPYAISTVSRIGPGLGTFPGGPFGGLVVSPGRLGFICSSLACGCSGDADCNDMFTSGLCGGFALCEGSGATARCICLRY
jgi:hypothetical protein